jgi:hypothetical protein
MRRSNTTLIRLLFTIAFCSFIILLQAQQITGVWKGKIDRKKVEVKIIQKGDSLTGTSYYYESANQYRRYTIKGYFDPNDNSVVWWDDQLIKDKGGPSKDPLLSIADFNCPGAGKMLLGGKSFVKQDPNETKGPVDLSKTNTPSFPDEWDFVIDNYTVGTNDPDIIDSVSLIAFTPVYKPTQPAILKEDPNPKILPSKPGREVIPSIPEPKPVQAPIAAKPLTIEEKFSSRQKAVTKEIPIEGDSIELRFYDNAEVDGDSISLFLNDKMIFTHIRLSEKAYTVKLATRDLQANNELTMVAENLGAIPPNTSYMVALSGAKRYEAHLASTENSSAVIRLRKQ